MPHATADYYKHILDHPTDDTIEDHLTRHEITAPSPNATASTSPTPANLNPSNKTTSAIRRYLCDSRLERPASMTANAGMMRAHGNERRQ